MTWNEYLKNCSADDCNNMITDSHVGPAIDYRDTGCQHSEVENKKKAGSFLVNNMQKFIDV